MNNPFLSFYLYNNEIIPASEPDYFKKSSNKTVIYEVIRIIDGKPLFFEDHISRFFKSLENYQLDNIITSENIKTQIEKLISINKVKIGNCRFFICFSQNSSPDFYAYFIPHSYPSGNDYLHGVKLISFIAERNNPTVKAEQSELRKETQTLINSKGIYEVLLIHPNGHITEGSKSNFFLIKDNVLFTALPSDVLEGVTYKHINNLCRSLNIEIKKERIQAFELPKFDAAFISGTSPKILPVNTIDSLNFNVNNSLLRFLMEKFDEHINNYLLSH